MSETSSIKSHHQKIIEICLDRNSIVYLPSGAGKIFIATHVIKHFGSQLERKYSDGGKRAIFLVDSTNSAIRHAQIISNMLPYNVFVASESTGNWDEILDANEIIVVTAQAFLEAVTNSFIQLEQIAVVVLDKCHQSDLGHPHHEIAKRLKGVPVRIIGLTSKLNFDVDPNPSTLLANLEATFQGVIVTADTIIEKPNLSLVQSKAEETLTTYSEELLDPLIADVSKSLERMADMLRRVNVMVQEFEELFNSLKDFHDHATQMGALGAYVSLIGLLVQFELLRLSRKGNQKLREVVRSCISSTEQWINKMELKFGLGRDDPSAIFKNSSHKLKRLIFELRQLSKENRDGSRRCVVFVGKCSTAKVLSHVLKFFNVANQFLPDFIVSQRPDAPETPETILDSHFVSVVKEKFRSNEKNCVIASSAGWQDGINTPLCDFVVMFDKPNTNFDYARTKQRAKSNYIVLVKESEVEGFKKEVQVWRDVEGDLKEQLRKKAVVGCAPTEDSTTAAKLSTTRPAKQNTNSNSHWSDFNIIDDSLKLRKHFHEVRTPKVFQNSSPTIGSDNFLYRIIIKPVFEPPCLGIRTFNELMGNSNEFAILTSKRIPKLCEMKFFMLYGEVEVKISDEPILVKLHSETELNQLQSVHVMIFRDVLGMWRDFFALDQTSFLIVPVMDSSAIHWSLVNDLQSRLDVTSDGASLHQVVSPAHRPTDKKFIVIQVHDEMSPDSPFPDPKFSSFREFFRTDLKDANQPIIEVTRIHLDLNLLLPVNPNKVQKHDKPEVTEFYIPELCHKHKLPGDYWLKALLLPSIYHRMCHLLCVEELRLKLVNDGIDPGDEQQKLRLDVDHDDVEELGENVEDIEREAASYGRLWNFSKLLQKPTQPTDETRHTKARLLWRKSVIPLDIDRNWLDVAEPDLVSYFYFLKTQEKASRQQKDVKGHEKFLTDSADRKIIKMIHATGGSLQQKDLIKALTAPSVCQGDLVDVFDMDRFRVLGDAFVSFAAALNLFENHHGNQLTMSKENLVGNQNLFSIGDDFGLTGMIKSTQFHSNESMPPAVALPRNLRTLLEGDLRLLNKLFNIQAMSDVEILSGRMDELSLETFVGESEISHFGQDGDGHVDENMLVYIKQCQVSEGAVADAVKALVGVVLQSLGVDAGMKLCRKFKILPADVKLKLKERIPSEAAQVPNRRQFEKIIRYEFHDAKLLMQALTHSSCREGENSQRLKFLGETALDFLVTAYITEQCPRMNPRKLNDLRMALTNNVTLAGVIVRKGIHKFLRSESFQLAKEIQKFVDYQASRGNRVAFDEHVLLVTEDDYTSGSIDVPKAIGEMFESTVGAVFVDSSFDLSTTWKLINELLSDELQEFMANVPVSAVRELFARFKLEEEKKQPEFYGPEDVDDDLVAVPLKISWNFEKKTFIGIGKNEELAKNSAVKLAVKALNEIVK